jgi:hypothetical protein
MLRHLEVQALANPDANVHFALLSDFTDAVEPTRADDDAILEAASRGVAELNAAHGPQRFFLFHRVRRWNPNEGLWMGWERKRGKLEELNRLLRGATDTSFGLQVGDLSVLPSVRYVLTLDSDTRLPRDAARALVGILEHPLNRPRLDSVSRRVVAGYGILQPRIAIATTSAAASRFARVFSGHTGVDPYTTAVSDTYQDLFGEGVFTACTTSTPSGLPSRAGSPRTPCFPTISSRACTRGRRSSRTSRSWTTTRATSSPTRGASTAGCAATGRSCGGSFPSFRRARASSATGSRSSRSGRSSTT